MWWGIGIIGAILWITLFALFAMGTLANGHTWLFWFGFIFPVLWIFGAFMEPTEKAIARGA